MEDAQILEVTQVGPLQALGPDARNRIVVPPERFEAHSPFVLMVEDFISGGHEYHMHPHRGIETVTLFLDGEMEHVDNFGTTGVAVAGDVQWMTAGHGIMHGGRPHGTRPVHALQLWLNLPAERKMSAAGTRVQSRAEAALLKGEGVTARIFGERSRAEGMPPWSRWPMTLTDIEAAADATFDLPVPSGERVFIHVISGEVVAGTTRVCAGQTGWLDLAPLVERNLSLRTVTAARIVAYAAVPINEPVVAHGPFVMNTESEIRQAYADLRNGLLIDQSR